MTGAAVPATGRLDRRLYHLLAWALMLSTATQLRMPGAPLGPGELLLVGWVAGAWGVMALRQRTVVSRPALPFVAFWSLALVVLLAGALRSTVEGDIGHTVFHDLAAFLFVTVLVVTFALFAPGRATLEFMTGRMLSLCALALFGILLGTLLVPAVSSALGGAGVSVWWGPRYRGWALNPNQLSLVMSAAPFLCLELRRRSTRRGERAWYVLVALLCVAVGLATLSDGLILAWTVGAAVTVAAGYRNGAVLGGWGRWGALLAYGVVPVVALAGLLAIPFLWSLLEAQVSDMFNTEGQGSTRVQLWVHGVQAAFTSPVVGLGPGAFSGDDRPFQEFEAHNTLVDWTASTGLLGLSLYLGLLVWVFAGIWRGRHSLLIAVVPALFCFGLVHYTFRQPVFWFYLMIVAALSRAEEAPPADEDEDEDEGGRLGGVAPAPA